MSHPDVCGGPPAPAGPVCGPGPRYSLVRVRRPPFAAPYPRAAAFSALAACLAALPAEFFRVVGERPPWRDRGYPDDVPADPTPEALYRALAARVDALGGAPPLPPWHPQPWAFRRGLVPWLARYAPALVDVPTAVELTGAFGGALYELARLARLAGGAKIVEGAEPFWHRWVALVSVYRTGSTGGAR